MVAARGRLGVLDGAAVRRWAAVALTGLSDARAEIDRLNVYPIPDSDTGTNLVRTLRAGVEALADEPGPDLAAVTQTLADAVLRGACGNSGTILAQLLRGIADAARGADQLDPTALAAALSRAATLARGALARPVDGTILSVCDAAAGAAAAAVQGAGGAVDLAAVVRAAHQGAARALALTPGQLPALGGRVDAGGRGLVVLLAALEAVVTGADDPSDHPSATDPPAGPDGGAESPPAAAEPAPGGPAHEVMYLLDSTPEVGEAERIADLRTALDRIGDSVLVVGGNGLWQVHAHVDDVGAALELGLAAGRPYRVRITTFGTASGSAAGPDEFLPAGLDVVAVVDGPGVADLLSAAGARVVEPGAGLAGRLITAVQLPSASLVAVVPGTADALATAQQVAEGRPRVRVVRSWSCVQAMAALAVHDPAHDPGQDLLQMATAAAGCRHGLVEVAEGDGVTSVGVCHRGDVLGHVNGDVAVIGHELEAVAAAVLDLLLGGGGELVTIVAGQPAPAGLADRVAAAVHARRPDVDLVTYDGGQPGSYLVVGVE